MDLKAIAYYAWLFVCAVGSYLIYDYRKMNTRIERLEQKVQQMAVAHAEVAVEIKEIRSNLNYIRTSLDKLLEKL